jgi:hypothetical protein
MNEQKKRERQIKELLSHQPASGSLIGDRFLLLWQTGRRPTTERSFFLITARPRFALEPSEEAADGA